MFSFPLLLTIYAGFTHAFEADHLLAVSNIVSQRNNIKMSLKDGAYWGLGHASTIIFIGFCMLLFKAVIATNYFRYFEATVGIMLVLLAVYRLMKYYRSEKIVLHAHPHQHAGEEHGHPHFHISNKQKQQHAHSLAYGIGLVHGLAGSGALILVVMSQIKAPAEGIFYLLIFGVGCIFGMSLAAGLFSIPFSKKIMKGQVLQRFLVISSCLLCLLYGGFIFYKNLFVLI